MLFLTLYIFVSPARIEQVFKKHDGDFMKDAIDVGEQLLAACTAPHIKERAKPTCAQYTVTDVLL